MQLPDILINILPNNNRSMSRAKHQRTQRKGIERNKETQPSNERRAIERRKVHNLKRSYAHLHKTQLNQIWGHFTRHADLPPSLSFIFSLLHALLPSISICHIYCNFMPFTFTVISFQPTSQFSFHVN